MTDRAQEFAQKVMREMEEAGFNLAEVHTVWRAIIDRSNRCAPPYDLDAAWRAYAESHKFTAEGGGDAG